MEPGSLRPASAADHRRYVAYHAELATGDPPLEPARWETECAPTTVFLVERGREVGYAHWEQAGEHVHVRHVVVDARERGRGVGRRLLLALAEGLRARGATEWRLNVLASNAPAIALYERVGFSRRFATAVVRLPWEHARRLPRADARCAEADPALDAAHERRFGLLPGQLAGARAKSGVSVLAAQDACGEPAGVAAFDPSFPGAFPFRCERPEHVAALVEGMRARYAGERPYVQLVLEDAPGIAAAVEAAGAQRVHDIVHMRGALPR